MTRKHLLTPLLALLLLTLAACGGSQPEKPTGQGSEYVEAVEMKSSLNYYVGLRCIEGYQTFDIDDVRKPSYKALDMKITVNSDGEFYDDNETTDKYDGFYSQDWVRLKMTLRDDLELPVVIVHARNTNYDEVDDQVVAPEIGAGGKVDMRLATDNYLGGLIGEISGLTLCLQEAS